VNKDSAISVSDVEGIYALERVKRAPTKPGQYFQLPPAGALFDQLKDTDVAKKLGEKFVPGAWFKF